MGKYIFSSALAQAGLAIAAALFISLGPVSCSKDKNKPKSAQSVITMTTSKDPEDIIMLKFGKYEAPNVEGAIKMEKLSDGTIKYKLQSKDLIIRGNVTKFTCSKCQLTSLDVSNNPELTFLSCVDNSLTDLDVSKNQMLTFLDCGKNSLESLDLSNNPKLKMLNCNDNNFKTLDITNYQNLVSCDCSRTNLESLRVNNTKLGVLRCPENNLKSLDLSGAPKLQMLLCECNELNYDSLILPDRRGKTSPGLYYRADRPEEKNTEFTKLQVKEVKVNKNWTVWHFVSGRWKECESD